MARRMTNIVGGDSIHCSIWSSKLWATTWARPIYSNSSTDAWAKVGGFLGGQNYVGVL